MADNAFKAGGMRYLFWNNKVMPMEKLSSPTICTSQISVLGPVTSIKLWMWRTGQIPAIM